MIYEDDYIFSVFRILLITAGTIGMMTALTPLKYSLKKIFIVFGSFMVYVAISTALIIYFFDYYFFTKVFIFTISVPGIYLAYKANYNSPTQSVFNYSTQIVLSILLIPVCIGINSLISGNKFTHLLICFVVYSIVIFVQYRFLRKPFIELLQVIQTGWGILSLIPISYCVLLAVVSSYPIHYLQNPVVAPYIVVIVITLFIVYFAVYKSLMVQYKLQMLARDRDVLAVQISAMNKQADVVFATEEKLRILRHDVRHFAITMRSLLAEGGTVQAETVLSKLESTLNDNSYKSYCENYMVNSILSTYFELAEQEGITVKVQFTTPPEEQVDSVAFSVMLSNALENALKACQNEENPCVIELKAHVVNGQYMMELSNTCNAVVDFDKNGFPIAQNGDRQGIGTRGIVAFAKENGGAISFRLEDNLFILQMILGL